ncbi:bL21 family ribosomal protein, partial [Pseudomonas sp. NPDC090964]
MSYAVIVTGGKQYKVAPGEYLKIEKLEIATGAPAGPGGPCSSG